MARFYGVIGFSQPGELISGVYKDVIVERPYTGKILNETINSNEEEKIHEDVRLSSRISIVADGFALGNYANMKYVKSDDGVFWTVNSVELKRPRLILSTGGVYHGPIAQ